VTDPSVLPSVAEAAEIIGWAREWAQETNTMTREMSEDKTLELDIRVSHFSDHFVFSLPISPTAEVGLTATVGQLCIYLIERGHYTRGAIVRGLVHHTPNVIYGPALLEAHRIESCVAKYPRIVVTPDAGDAFELGTVLRKDFDGLTHLDYLRPYRPTAEQISWLGNLKTIVDGKVREDAGRLERLSKHWWFIGYLDEVLV
jgi:hypothetical protein